MHALGPPLVGILHVASVLCGAVPAFADGRRRNAPGGAGAWAHRGAARAAMGREELASRPRGRLE
ncbi:hypothetical protein SACE_6386 [Saccharopolyspora erythraea NRRL 2338]|uniref:Uncharacterized protein n=1 Tax=Saccharopolyspora erythraea (strain ATCC 11635 / DSM 40517 / JCM 4748 / NBRC 13426 / NCIMB 8594 / NRRL 2338) TaxID=405948 RepID=A4FND1_SACEN|nr:hypothetical protein SACE_6386 [Saccharopolyspora erythraea NRRL 2338]